MYMDMNLIMMTSSDGNIFRVTGPLCWEFTGPRWIPRTRASDAELWCFFDLRLNRRLSKQSWGWWFETQSGSLWRHCSDYKSTILSPVVWALLPGLFWFCAVILPFMVSLCHPFRQHGLIQFHRVFNGKLLQTWYNDNFRSRKVNKT